ncbi:MAG: putative transcriptional regulator [Firmicutes bacterium]|nr:putative transcriptional regulator [Bacillota bacterium]
MKKFGEFIEERRKKAGITLRGLAGILEIAPSYMSDIEKGRRYPPDKEKLDEIAKQLMLSEDDKNLMFDLAAKEKENTISPDLPEYIMEKDLVRVALRKARDNNVSDRKWERIIKILDESEEG